MSDRRHCTTSPVTFAPWPLSFCHRAPSVPAFPLQDERCAKLSLFPFLEKVYLERILQPGEVSAASIAYSTQRRTRTLPGLWRGSRCQIAPLSAPCSQGGKQRWVGCCAQPAQEHSGTDICPSQPCFCSNLLNASLPARHTQVESFAQGLQQHQLAKLPDGSTVLERSVTEHNLEVRCGWPSAAHVFGIADQKCFEQS